MFWAFVFCAIGKQAEARLHGEYSEMIMERDGRVFIFENFGKYIPKP
jgi:hypothetical protein